MIPTSAPRKRLAQHETGFRNEICGTRKIARLVEMPVMRAKIRFDFSLRHMDGRRHDVARPFTPHLHDVFAEIRLDHTHPSAFEVRIEGDLFRDHRLALCNELRICLPADIEYDRARFSCRPREMHDCSLRLRFGDEHLEIAVEMLKRMITDVARSLSQVLELWHARFGHRALPSEPIRQSAERLLQVVVCERLSRKLRKGSRLNNVRH